jgi:hypothetical protein
MRERGRDKKKSEIERYREKVTFLAAALMTTAKGENYLK